MRKKSDTLICQLINEQGIGLCTYECTEMAGQLLPEGIGRNSHHLTSTQYIAQNPCFMSFKKLCQKWTIFVINNQMNELPKKINEIFHCATPD